MSIFFTILQVLAGLAVTVIVLAQSGKSAGLSGSISGGADTFMAKGKAKTLDAKLAKLTKWFALGFVVLTLVLNLMYKSGTDTAVQSEEEPAATTEVLDDSEQKENGDSENQEQDQDQGDENGAKTE